jgi:FkbM family methyltransferase
VREHLWWRLRENRVVRRLLAWGVPAALLRRASLYLLPSSTHKWLRVQSGLGEGLTLELSPRWENQIWTGLYEPAVQRTVVEHFKPGKIVYDVGGGIGFYALAAARSGARVFTFEPDPRNFACIENNARANGLAERLDLLRVAAFSRTGTMLMEPSDRRHGHGHAHAKEIWDSGAAEVFEIACTTLDDFARGHSLPDLVKIDVEGCEVEVLRGAEWLMRDVRPAILCEVHDSGFARDAAQLIERRGYSITWLDDRERPRRWIYAQPA